MSDYNELEFSGSTGEVEVRANSVPDLNQVLASLGGKGGVLSTLPRGTQAERLAVAAAVTGSTAISEELGKTINVVGVIVQAVEMANEDTGEIQLVPRVIFYDDKGVGHHAISGPLFRDARTMLGLVGMPNLAAGDAPIPIKITQGGEGRRKYFKLEYVTK